MVSVGGKFWFGVTAFAVAALVVHLVASGEDFGTLVLGALVVAALLIAIATNSLRDGEVPASGATATSTAAAAGGGAAAPVGRSQLPAPWPPLAAVGVGAVVVGLAADGRFLWVGVGILVVAAVEWMVQGWAERATTDRATNRELRHRLMYPIEIPVLALLIAAVVVLAFSRVLLALPKEASTVIAIVVAATILGVAALLSARPRLSSSVLTGVAVAGALVLIGGGIVGAVVGERDFEVHEDEAHEEEGTETGDGAEDGGAEQGDAPDEAEPSGDADVEPEEPEDRADFEGGEEETDETTSVSSP